jgi:hypothetical protein
MEPVFWDRKGVLMVEFMQRGTTIMSEVYCEQKAWNADIHVVLLHDNVHLHAAAHTRTLLEHFIWGLFDLTALTLL